MPDRKLFITRTKTVKNGGVPGVHRRLFNGIDSWLAHIRIDGKTRTRIFSILKYGEVEAQRRALEVRLTWLKEAGFDDMIKPGPSREEIDLIEKEIRLRFGEGPPTKTSGFAGFKSMSMYGITRAEANALGKCGSWKVILMRRGIRHQKTFYDHSYGGSEAGLQKAQSFRDEILRIVEPLKKRELHEIVPSNNTSGVVGVYLVQTRKLVRSAWVAEICIDGKLRTKRFSITQLGDERAFELAVLARKAMVDSVQGYRLPSPVLKEWVGSLPADR